MGRILPNTRVTNANVRHYIEQATKDYSTFLNSAPTFCTYFSKNHLKSTYDRGLENINEVIGADSPVEFDQIDNLPIYKVENASFGTEITDFGVVGNVSSSAIILPDTIVPSSDDVFEIEYQNERKVFIVTDVEQDNYNNSKYFKITFKLSSFNIEDVEEQVAEEYTVDYNLIGKTSNPIIKRTDFDLYLAMEGVYDSLLERYDDTYYSKETSCYVDSESDPLGRPIIDVMLNYFVLHNKLEESFKIYRRFKYLDLDILKKVKPSRYKKSLYSFAEKAPSSGVDIDSTNTETRYVVVGCGASRYSQDWFSKTNHYLATPLESGAVERPEDIVISPFSPELISKIKANDTTDLGKLQTFVVRYLNAYYNKENFSELLQDLDDTEESVDDYRVVPLVLYAIKHYRKEIIGRPNVN
jgi:hypothetical protein